MSRKVIFWTSRIDELVQGKGMVCGITIQMYFWAKFFAKKSWKSFSFTENKENDSKEIEKIRFIFNKRHKHFNAFLKPFKCLKFILKYRPDVVFQRGRSDDSFYLALLSVIFRFKFVLMIAADSSLLRGNEAYLNYQTKLFRLSMSMIKYVVVQNVRQRELLCINYSKSDSLLIPNIWEVDDISTDKSRDSVLWVGNIGEVKRPLMYLSVVEKFQNVYEYEDLPFLMIGGSANDELYDITKSKAEALKNIEFLGSCSFNQTNLHFSRAKILVCTSSSEGFPNTFLQAWANGIPIVTTFDPSGVIAKNNLGIVVSEEKQLFYGLRELYENRQLYLEITNNVKVFFKKSYKTDNQYNRLIETFNLLNV